LGVLISFDVIIITTQLFTHHTISSFTLHLQIQHMLRLLANKTRISDLHKKFANSSQQLESATNSLKLYSQLHYSFDPKGHNVDNALSMFSLDVQVYLLCKTQITSVPSEAISFF
jgi:hypothetical protein